MFYQLDQCCCKIGINHGHRKHLNSFNRGLRVLPQKFQLTNILQFHSEGVAQNTDLEILKKLKVKRLIYNSFVAQAHDIGLLSFCG